MVVPTKLFKHLFNRIIDLDGFILVFPPASLRVRVTPQKQEVERGMPALEVLTDVNQLLGNWAAVALGIDTLQKQWRVRDDLLDASLKNEALGLELGGEGMNVIIPSDSPTIVHSALGKLLDQLGVGSLLFLSSKESRRQCALPNTRPAEEIDS
jgi:hypothetical protein